MMMGISQPKAAVVMQEPLRKLVSQGRAIALGGKLNEFDPCNVGQPLPSRLRGAALPKGRRSSAITARSPRSSFRWPKQNQ